MNILLLQTKALIEEAEKVFNPRNAMIVSHNDGLMNEQFNHRKDILVLLNTFLSMTNDMYSASDEAEMTDCMNYTDEESEMIIY